MTIQRFLILFALSWMIMACNKEEDPCEKCNAAIQHMCEKIEQNACDPAFMENALERLRNDCGAVSGPIFAGYMAHTCAFESSLDCGTCISEDGDIKTGHLSILETPFQLSTSSIVPESVFIQVYEKDRTNAVNEFTTTLEPGVSISFTDPDPLFNGEIIAVRVMDFTTQDTLAEAEATLRFARPGNWVNIRGIEVTYDYNVSQYVVEFERW